jgi:glycosyltransferase involved in cell wall biosynthesis
MIENEKISLIVPIFNEVNNVEPFFKNINNLNKKYINEIIFIDDGSSDDSNKKLNECIDAYKITDQNKETSFLVLKNLKNRGYGFSLKKGIKNSLNNLNAIIDLDLSYGIDDLNKLSEFMVNNSQDFDLVIGKRKIDETNTKFIKRIGKALVNKITNIVFSENILDYNSGLRIFKKELVLKYINIYSDRFSFTTSMTISFLSQKHDIKFIDIDYKDRGGDSKLKTKDFFSFMYTIFSLLFFFKPFKILLPLIIPGYFLFVYFLIIDFQNSNLTDKTMLLFNFSFLATILIFLTDKFNKLK